MPNRGGEPTDTKSLSGKALAAPLLSLRERVRVGGIDDKGYSVDSSDHNL